GRTSQRIRKTRAAVRFDGGTSSARTEYMSTVDISLGHSGGRHVPWLVWPNNVDLEESSSARCEISAANLAPRDGGDTGRRARGSKRDFSARTLPPRRIAPA